MIDHHARSAVAYALQQWAQWKDNVMYQRFHCESVQFKNSPLKNTDFKHMDLEVYTGDMNERALHSPLRITDLKRNMSFTVINCAHLSRYIYVLK
jgi:hypothetical protein